MFDNIGDYGISILLSVLAAAFYEYASRYFNRDAYRKRVEDANRDILNMVFPLVVSGNMPDAATLGGYVFDTSRHRRVRPEDLFTLEQISNFLVKETMDQVFLQPAQRAVLSAAIAKWRAAIDVDYKKLSPEKQSDGFTSEFWRNVCVGVVSFQTAFVLVFDWTRDGGVNRLFSGTMAAAPLLVALLVPFILLFFGFMTSSLSSWRSGGSSTAETHQRPTRDLPSAAPPADH